MNQVAKKTRPSLTEKKVAQMLKENTGRALCDSGDAYGRNWERNQTRDFASEPDATLDGRFGISFTANIYHWLVDKLEYDPVMQSQFTRFERRPEQEKNPWLQSMRDFMEHRRKIVEKKGKTFGGIYGEGDYLVVNSYNGACHLSQTVQFVYWTEDGEEHILLQVHGGCDARSGYSAPKAFTCSEELVIFQLADSTIYCSGDAHDKTQEDLIGHDECRKAWDTDDDYHWYPVEGDDQELNEYEMVEESEENPEWRAGILFVRQDGTILCPHCGSTLGAHYR